MTRTVALLLLLLQMLVLNAVVASPLGPVQWKKVGASNVGYRQGGHGPDLVMIMGRSGTMADWDPRLLDILVKHRKVTIFDNRWVGTTTTASTSGASIAQFANDTVGLMDALGIASADMIGWSMGTYILQTILVKYPSRVKKAVLAATDGGYPVYVYPEPFIQKILLGNVNSVTLLLLSFPLDSAGLKGADQYVTAIANQTGLVPNSFNVSTQAQQYQEEATAYFKFNASVFNQLSLVKKQVLISYGDLDLLVKPKNDMIVANQIHGSKQCVFRNAGHAFLFQDYSTFGKMSLTFLDTGKVPKVINKQAYCV